MSEKYLQDNDAKLPNPLSLMFLVNEQTKPMIQKSKQINDKEASSGLDKRVNEVMNKKIQLDLYIYKHHYLQNLCQVFPGINIHNVLVAPKVISQEGWLLLNSSKKLRQINYPFDKQFWIPIFYNQNRPKQYFQEQLKYICILIHNGYQYQVFMGYVPQLLFFKDIIRALADFFFITFKESMVYQSQKFREIQSISDILNKKISETQDQYIKICDLSEYLDPLDAVQINKQQQNRWQDYQLGEFGQQRICTGQFQVLPARNQPTYIPQVVQKDQSLNERFNKRLLRLVDQKQVTNYKQICRSKAKIPSLFIANKEQEEMVESLQNIIQQLKSKIKQNVMQNQQKQ